jgi:acetyltransferase-like isoleucine patch superfamily enzyme
LTGLKEFFKNIAIQTGAIKIYRFFWRAPNRLRAFATAVKYYFYNSFLTNFPSYSVRAAYLRHILKIKIGKDTSIHMGCFFAGNNIKIGNNNVIARNCYLDGRIGTIEIKNNVSMGPEAYVLSMSHDVNSPTFAPVIKPVVIGDYVWLGARVLIMPGVVAGDGCVIGAASVVTKSIEPYTIVAGSPAKKIGQRNNNLVYKLHYFPFFNTDIA